MPARTRRGTAATGWSDNVRERIKSSMLINRLNDHVLGKIELAATQVTAALGLLRKTLPDLASIEHEGEVKIVRDISTEPLTESEWTEKHATAH